MTEEQQFEGLCHAIVPAGPRGAISQVGRLRQIMDGDLRGRGLSTSRSTEHSRAATGEEFSLRTTNCRSALDQAWVDVSATPVTDGRRDAGHQNAAGSVVVDG